MTMRHMVGAAVGIQFALSAFAWTVGSGLVAEERLPQFVYGLMLFAGHCQVNCATAPRVAADHSSADGVRPRPRRSTSRTRVSAVSLVPGPELMPADGDEIPHDAMHRQEALRVRA
jgi:hypothetical protein